MAYIQGEKPTEPYVIPGQPIGGIPKGGCCGGDSDGGSDGGGEVGAEAMGPGGGPVVGEPPVVDDAQFTTSFNVPITIDKMSLGSDPEDGPLPIVVVKGDGGNGTVADNADGTCVYTPNEGHSGEDTFQICVIDSDGNTSAFGTITVTTNPPTAELVTTKINTSSNTEGPYAEGDIISFAINVENLGPDPATSVTLTDLLPAGLTLSNTPIPTAGTYDPATGLWDIGNVAVGAIETLTLDGEVNAGYVDDYGDTALNVTTPAAGNEVDPNSVADDLEEEVNIIDVPLQKFNLSTEADDDTPLPCPIEYPVTTSDGTTISDAAGLVAFANASHPDGWVIDPQGDGCTLCRPLPDGESENIYEPIVQVNGFYWDATEGADDETLVTNDVKQIFADGGSIEVTDGAQNQTQELSSSAEVLAWVNSQQGLTPFLDSTGAFTCQWTGGPNQPIFACFRPNNATDSYTIGDVTFMYTNQNSASTLNLINFNGEDSVWINHDAKDPNPTILSVASGSGFAYMNFLMSDIDAPIANSTDWADHIELAATDGGTPVLMNITPVADSGMAISIPNQTVNGNPVSSPSAADNIVEVDGQNFDSIDIILTNPTPLDQGNTVNHAYIQGKIRWVPRVN